MGPADGPVIHQEIKSAWNRIPKQFRKFADSFDDKRRDDLMEMASMTFLARQGVQLSSEAARQLADDRVLATLASEAYRLRESNYNQEKYDEYNTLYHEIIEVLQQPSDNRKERK